MEDGDGNKRKETKKIAVKQGFLEEFDKAYLRNCDKELMRAKHRNLSCDNPFESRNVPPREHREADRKIIQKPNQIDITKQSLNDSQKVAAGRLSELGSKILELGSKAKFLYTGPWNELQMVENPNTRNKAFMPCIGKPNGKRFDNSGIYSPNQTRTK